MPPTPSPTTPPTSTSTPTTTTGLDADEIKLALDSIEHVEISRTDVSELALDEVEAELELIGDPHEPVRHVNELWKEMSAAHRAAVEEGERLIGKVFVKRQSLEEECQRHEARKNKLEQRARELRKAGAESQPNQQQAQQPDQQSDQQTDQQTEEQQDQQQDQQPHQQPDQ